MNLSEILSPDRVVTGMVATSKKRAMEELSKLLGKGTDAVGDGEIFSSLTAREKLGSTGLGHGVAIPHGRLNTLDVPLGAMVRLKHPVDYEAHDGQSVDLMFALVVPQRATETHIECLAAIAELFSDEDFCKQARACVSDAALHTLIVDRR